MASVLLAACAKQPDLPDITVSAISKEEFARFRAGLGTRFAPDRLKDFDTATQELQLDAMSRNIRAAADREADMLRVAHGKTVHAVTVLGWQARKARFLREVAEIDQMLAHDLQLQAKTAVTDTPDSVIRRIGSEREILDKLHRDLADTERRLAELNQSKP